MAKTRKLEFYRTVLAFEVQLLTYKIPKSVKKYKAKPTDGTWDFGWNKELTQKGIDDLIQKLANTLTQTSYGLVFVDQIYTHDLGGNLATAEMKFYIPKKIQWVDGNVILHTTCYTFTTSKTGRNVIITQQVTLTINSVFTHDCITLRDFKKVLDYYYNVCECKAAKTLKAKLDKR